MARWNDPSRPFETGDDLIEFGLALSHTTRDAMKRIETCINQHAMDDLEDEMIRSGIDRAQAQSMAADVNAKLRSLYELTSVIANTADGFRRKARVAIEATREARNSRPAAPGLRVS